MPPPITTNLHTVLRSAGRRLRPLQQVHAYLITTNTLTLPLFTHLLSLSSATSLPYTLSLLHSPPTPDPFLLNTLLRLSSSLLPSLTLQFFPLFLSLRLPPSSHSFTSLFKACTKLNAGRYGRVAHGQAVVFGLCEDLFVGSALVGFYMGCGFVGVARMLFERMVDRDVVAWNSVVNGYVQNGFAEMGLRVFEEMGAQGVEADEVTLVAVLGAGAQLGRVDLGRWARGYIREKGIELSVVLGTALIGVFSRGCAIEEALDVFDEMEERNVVAWTALISGYGVNGYGDRAVELFKRMRSEGLRPNEVTFVAVLSACAHAGLVEEGRQVFKCMRKDYNMVAGVEHHVCMVDMLGRAGMLDEAIHFINEFVPGEPNPAVWTALLGACKMHKNFGLGVEVAERLLAAEPDNPGHYVLLSNIYASAGRMDQVETIRRSMVRRRLKKQIGWSVIEIDNVTHMFRMGDKSHPQTHGIHQYLEELISKARQFGYTPETKSVLHELEEEEMEYALRFHSEKLAVAFGIMSTEDETSIKVVKNLRMCEDCHLAIKFISAISKREIFVRDNLRFHHFKDGSCSCRDYW